MTDEFEEQLRAAQPAEVPADLMRRLRHAEPALAPEGQWRRWALVAAAAAVLAGLFIHPDWWLTDAGSPARKHGRIARMNLPTEDASRIFAGTIAMNIRLGASPDLTPVSLRPDYDPRTPGRSDRFGGELNFRVEIPILNNTTTN